MIEYSEKEEWVVTNVLDYIKWRGDLTFSQDGPNEVDALIFSALAYIRYGGAVEEKPEEPVTLREAANAFLEREDYAGRIRRMLMIYYPYADFFAVIAQLLYCSSTECIACRQNDVVITIRF